VAPLLFLDIDGTLLPFGGPAPAVPATDLAGATAGNPLLARLDPAHGPRLMALGCELIWATSWLDDANDTIAPRLGMPELPVMSWPDDEGPAGVHWKTAALVDRAAGRPFIWVDDEIGARDRIWVAAHHAGPALLHRVESRLGLTDADYATIERWIGDLGRAPAC